MRNKTNWVIRKILFLMNCLLKMFLGRKRNVKYSFEITKQTLEGVNMEKIEVKEKVMGVIEKLCGITPENEEARLLENIGFDSLRMVMLLIEIEETFGIELDESDLNPFKLITVKDVINLAEKYVGQ